MAQQTPPIRVITKDDPDVTMVDHPTMPGVRCPESTDQDEPGWEYTNHHMLDGTTHRVPIGFNEPVE